MESNCERCFVLFQDYVRDLHESCLHSHSGQKKKKKSKKKSRQRSPSSSSLSFDGEVIVILKSIFSGTSICLFFSCSLQSPRRRGVGRTTLTLTCRRYQTATYRTEEEEEEEEGGTRRSPRSPRAAGTTGRHLANRNLLRHLLPRHLLPTAVPRRRGRRTRGPGLGVHISSTIPEVGRGRRARSLWRRGNCRRGSLSRRGGSSSSSSSTID